MMIGQRLHEIREAKNMSQGDIENRSGLLRCYVSRVENGHTIPSVETLERLATALGVPIYQFFYVGDEPARPPQLLKEADSDEIPWGNHGAEKAKLKELCACLRKMSENQRRLLLAVTTAVVGVRRRMDAKTRRRSR